MSEHYGEWHTLTVGFDGEEDGKPLLDYTVEHPVGCPPAGGDCWLEYLVGEFHDSPDIVGLPIAPGVHRVRAVGVDGSWAGAHYIEPDSWIETDDPGSAEPTP